MNCIGWIVGDPSLPPNLLSGLDANQLTLLIAVRKVRLFSIGINKDPPLSDQWGVTLADKTRPLSVIEIANRSVKPFPVTSIYLRKVHSRTRIRSSSSWRSSIRASSLASAQDWRRHSENDFAGVIRLISWARIMISLRSYFIALASWIQHCLLMAGY